jgi:hypothetical protein
MSVDMLNSIMVSVDAPYQGLESFPINLNIDFFANLIKEA